MKHEDTIASVKNVAKSLESAFGTLNTAMLGFVQKRVEGWRNETRTPEFVSIAKKGIFASRLCLKVKKPSALLPTTIYGEN